MEQSNRSLLSWARVGIAAGAVALLAEGPPARAQNVTFTIAPYIWFTAISTDVTIGSRSTSVDASFIDLVNNSDTLIGLMGFGAVQWGNWSLFVDGLWSRLTGDSNVGPIPVDTRLTTSVLDFGLAYQFWLWDVQPRPGAWAVMFEPYVGGRWSTISASIEGQGTGPLGFVPISINVSKSASGVDPIFGARLVVSSPEGIFFRLAGDVGGFGVHTDFTWSASGLVGYEFVLFGVRQTAWIGYKAMGFDVKKNGAVPLSIDQVLHGPLVGVSFRF